MDWLPQVYTKALVKLSLQIIPEKGGLYFGRCYPAHHHSFRNRYLSCWTVGILIARIKGQLQNRKV